MMRTSRPGVFAAGDVRAGSVKLLAAVAGDAATAAIGAIRYLRTNDENKNMIGQGDDLGAAERVRIGSSG
jgi:thioredoxin reductase (NADPH)